VDGDGSLMMAARARPSVWIARKRLLGFVALVVLAVVAGLAPSSALAHAVLLRSDPPQNAKLAAPPSKVDLFFSEPLNRTFSTVQVVDTTGARHDKGQVHFTNDPTEMTVDLNQLAPGYYTVNWTTVSAVDGHRLQGTYPFAVLNPDGSAPSGAPPPSSAGGGGTGIQPFDALLRWLLLIGLMGFAAGFGFAAIVTYPAARSLFGDDRRAAASFALWLVAAVVPAAALVIVITNGAALLRQAELNGSLSAIPDLLRGRAGLYWIARETLPAVGAAVAWLLARRERRPEGILVPGLLYTGLALALLSLLTMSLTSHAAAGLGTAWAVPSDFLHLAGVALWLGSVAQLPALLRIRHGLSGAARSRFQGKTLATFSTMAVVCVGVVLLSGTFNALVQMPSWNAFVDTAYGRALLVKLALVAVVLALGLLNAVRIARRFERRALAADPTSDEQGARLARSAVLESVAGAAVVAATAVMVFLVPATSAEAQAQAQKSSKAPPVSSVYRNSTAASDLTVSLTVSPNRVGDNDFKVLLQGPDVDQVTRVELRFQFANSAVGQSTVDAQPVPSVAGLYDAQAANFSFVGLWRVTVNVRRNGHDDANGNFTVEVPDATGATTSATAFGSRSITTFPAHGITEQQAWGALVIAAGALLFVFRGKLWRQNRWAGVAGTFGMAGAAVIGATVIVMGGSTAATSGSFVQNPVPADQASIADGSALYQANCAKCHGTTGHGDGPLAAGLDPKPFDLTVHVGLHPDGQLYDWITNGIPRTAMPAWKNVLTDHQRWDILNYLRTLSVSSQQPASPAAPAVAAAPQAP